MIRSKILKDMYSDPFTQEGTVFELLALWQSNVGELGLVKTIYPDGSVKPTASAMCSVGDDVRLIETYYDWDYGVKMLEQTARFAGARRVDLTPVELGHPWLQKLYDWLDEHDATPICMQDFDPEHLSVDVLIDVSISLSDRALRAAGFVADYSQTNVVIDPTPGWVKVKKVDFV